MQAVERVLDLLEVLAATEEDLRLSELHEQLGLPLGTVHRLLATLVERGYAVQDPETQRYGPGTQLLVLSATASNHSRFRLQRLARPMLQELMRDTGETANLVLLEGHELVYIDQALGTHLVTMFTVPGRRAPLYCTGAGKAILSGFSEAQLSAYLHVVPLTSLTPQTLAEPQLLRDELARARERGFAIDDEEREEGVRCVAAPVFNALGAAIGALSVSGPTVRLSRARVYEMGPLVRDAAGACSVLLGYTPVPVPAAEGIAERRA